MKTLEQHLSQYAAYHRDRRNIVTHFIGIPLIVLAVAILLSRPGTVWAGMWFSPALIASCVLAGFYLRLDFWLGVLMTLLLGACVCAGTALAQQSTGLWLGSGVGLFVLGWVIQFVGHFYEGRKPAFVDDIMGLAIGPLFVVAEGVFLLGLRKELEHVVVTNAGPTCIRKSA